MGMESLASDLDNGIINLEEFERLLFQKASEAFSQPHDPELLAGEQIFTVSRNIGCSNAGLPTSTGSLFVTNYKLWFCPDDIHEKIDTTRANYADTLAISLPFCCIYRIEVTNINKPYFNLDVFARNGLTIRLSGFETKSPRNQRLYAFLLKAIFPITSGQRFFAFSKPQSPESDSLDAGVDGWKVYDAEREYRRLGIPQVHSKWRLADANKDFGFSPTYPQLLCVPAGVSDELLVEVGKYRSKARIPVLSWINQTNRCAILRCSQPMVGLNSRCQQDEELLSQIRRTVEDSHTLFIYDARPWLNAEANRAGGGGYENVANYEMTELEFAGIANIHNVRASLMKMQVCCQPSSLSTLDDTWMSAVDASEWLKHIRSILVGTLRVISLISEGRSVLIHCSDGWDRTALLTSTSMLLMDPYYRTLEGFIVLIEKEWVSLGHKFEDRLGYGNSNYEDEERSPVFIQFLDIVWQLTQQFPLAFGFSEDLLLFLAEEVYTCRFGTFLGNCEKDRAEMNVRTQTTSVWTNVLKPSEVELFTNPFYEASTTNQVLIPTVSSQSLGVWKRYHLRYNPAYRPPESLAAKAWKMKRELTALQKSGAVNGLTSSQL